MKRIFIAVKVVAGSNLLKLISSFREQLSAERIKWVNIENIHITLAFPGNTSVERIEAIDEMLKQRCSDFMKFEAVIRGAGVFKSMNDPKVVWAGIDQSEKLTELSRSIISDLKDIDIQLETRPFNPHITIGRIKQVERKDDLKRLIVNYQNVELQLLPVNEVTLYESILKPDGAIYRPLGIYPLL
jgi:2'-5' RNA ligase